MLQLNIGAAVFTSYHNINYYSGFLYCFFGRPYALVVTADTSTVVSAGIDAGQPWRRSLGSDDCVTYTDWQRNNYFHAVRNIVGYVPGKVGLEFDHVNLESKAKFDIAIPNRIVDIGLPTMEMRMIKSQEEIAVIRNGARIADLGGAAAVEALHDGVPEHEVALHSTQAMVREIANTYPDVEVMDSKSST